jgi:CRP/FNR family cyclic AMP-dependent transcriptional regulator
MLAEKSWFDFNSVFSFAPFLDEEEGAAVSHYFQFRELTAGTVLWREGDFGHSVVYVAEGRIEVKKETEFANKHVILGLLGERSFVGEFCLLSGGRNSATATALTAASVLEIDSTRFEELLKEYPVIGAKLLKGMLLGVSCQLNKSFERLVTIF